MLPLISFETGRKTPTQSSEQLQKAVSANGSLVLFQIGTTAERPTLAAKNPKELHPRSSVARRESFCPLDKDLSWKSRNRKTGTSESLGESAAGTALIADEEHRGPLWQLQNQSLFRAQESNGVHVCSAAGRQVAGGKRRRSQEQGSAAKCQSIGGMHSE
jgi:hypothetical protein